MHSSVEEGEGGLTKTGMMVCAMTDEGDMKISPFLFGNVRSKVYLCGHD